MLFGTRSKLSEGLTDFCHVSLWTHYCLFVDGSQYWFTNAEERTKLFTQWLETIVFSLQRNVFTYTSRNWHFLPVLVSSWLNWSLRACSHGGGGPQVGEVPRLGGVTNLSIQSLFFSWLVSHERWGTSPRRVARSAVPGNPLRWGEFSPCECWRWGGVMFSWAFIHYKTNWKAIRAAKKC